MKNVWHDVTIAESDQIIVNETINIRFQWVYGRNSSY